MLDDTETEDVANSENPQESDESKSHPKRVKCPHCDHVGWSKAYSTNILEHMKSRHTQLSGDIKCPFCEEDRSEFKVAIQLPFEKCAQNPTTGNFICYVAGILF